MRWRIEAADRQSGEDCVFEVELATRTDAEAFASRRGLLVSNVHRVEADTQPALEYESKVRAFAPALPRPLPPALPVAPPARQNAQYQVLTQKDRWLSSKFDPSTLEKALNAYAAQGWRVCAADTASFPGFLSGDRQEMICVLSREEGSEMVEYKVLSQKDRWLSGKFDPETLEKAINAYAQQGWRVVVATTASFPGFLSSNREELVLILERPKQ